MKDQVLGSGSKTKKGSDTAQTSSGINQLDDIKSGVAQLKKEVDGILNNKE